MKRLSITVFALFAVIITHAQAQYFGYKDNSFAHQVNTGTGAASATHPSAWLEVGPKANNARRGFLPPRGYKDSIQNPATGLIIFDMPTLKYWVFNSTAWESIGGSVDLSNYYTRLQVDALLAKKQDLPPGRVNGLVVTHISGLTFNVSAGQYVIGDSLYQTTGGQITLNAADPTNPRVDVIGVNTAGQVVKITGTPDANPAEPQTDPATQLGLTAVQIAAGATVPTGITNLVVYDEGSEWAHTTGGTITANFGSTAQAFSGTKSIAISAYSAGATITFSTGTAVPVADVATLSFWLRLTSAWANAQGITVQFLKGTATASNQVAATISKSTTGAWQNISYNMGALAFSQTTVDGIRFTFSGSTAAFFYIDYIRLQNGTGSGGLQKEIDPVFAANGVPKTTTITINGVTYDLSANRSWTIAAGGTATDTTNLSNRINLKLDISDTANMLANYRHWLAGYLTKAVADGYYVSLTGSYTNPAWIASLPAGKITGLATVATTGSYNDLTDKPTTSGGTLNNVGTGYDVAVQGTSNVKRLQVGFGVKLDTTTANVIKISADTSTGKLASQWYAQNNLAYDTTRTGTVAQRKAITSGLYSGYQFWQTDERIGLWIYNGTAWEHRPANWIMPQAATQQFWTTQASGTGASASYLGSASYADSARQNMVQVNTGTTATGFGAVQGTNLNNAGSPPVDSLSTTKARYVFYARMRLHQLPTAANDFRLVLGYRSGSAVANDSTSYGAYFNMNWWRSQNDSLMIALMSNGTLTQPLRVNAYPLTSLLNSYHDFVIVFSVRRAKYYVDGIYLGEIDLTGRVPGNSFIGPGNFFFGIFKTTGTTAALATISDWYIYQTHVQ